MKGIDYKDEQFDYEKLKIYMKFTKTKASDILFKI